MKKTPDLDTYKGSVFTSISDEKGKIIFEKQFGILLCNPTALCDVLMWHGSVEIFIKRHAK